MTDDLIAWLNQQIDDDERVANEAGGNEWATVALGSSVVAFNTSATFTDINPAEEVKLAIVAESQSEELVRHVTRNDPARVLREVAAKRKTLAVHRITNHPPFPGDDRPQHSCQRCDWTPEEELWNYGVACEAVLAIASVYSDRPGYRDEWKLT